MLRCLIPAVLVALAASAPPGAAQEGADVLVEPAAIVWGPASPKLPAGAQMAVLVGDPSAAGELYVFRAKLPDGYAVAPHTHPMDEHVTVLQGTMLLGFGEQRNDERLRELPPGSYVTLPADAPHFNRMRGETILQFHGIGPYDILYVDPADDPSTP